MTTTVSSSAELARRFPSRLSIRTEQGGPAGQDVSALQANLFEQILSLPVPSESFQAEDTALSSHPEPSDSLPASDDSITDYDEASDLTEDYTPSDESSQIAPANGSR
ncbi:MAG: hypothetical protein R3C53_01840 [Pirellulaceae bacterium]